MPAADILVLGIGNILWADEGFGVRALEALHDRWDMAEGVDLLDGGTQGLYLVSQVAGRRRLLVFDAVDYGLPPGTLKLVRDSAVPAFLGAKKVSLHQTGFQEVLSGAALLGRAPPEILLVGVQPLRIDDWGGGLTAVMEAALTPAVEAALDQLARWGAPARPAATPRSLLAHGLARSDYERPAPCARRS